MNIIAQTPLHLCQGKYAVEATVLVQKGAPNELLLGTDVLSKLGFVLAMETPERVVNLLGGKSLEINLEDPTGMNNGSPERHQTRMNNPPNNKPNSNQSMGPDEKQMVACLRQKSVGVQADP